MMIEEFLPYLIVCPLVFLAGFVDAIAGGGGLISLPAYLIAGLPPHLAIGTNKISSTIGTSVATVQYARRGFMPWRVAAIGAVLALAGSWAGANLTLVVPSQAFLWMMVIALPLTAWYILSRKKALVGGSDEVEPQWLKISVLALGIGAYDGFYGPGTGTFLMILLTGWAGLTLNKAAGVTKVINLSSNVMAMLVFFHNGTVLLPLGLTAAVFSMAGNYLGARTFVKNGASIARPVIIVVLAILLVKVVWGLFA